jgi:type II secretory pathway pseudopilin PulG
MNDNKKAGIPWSTIIIGIIIYALFMLWTGQRNENEKAKQVFAEQTARAENQLAATKQIEDKVICMAVMPLWDTWVIVSRFGGKSRPTLMEHPLCI